MPHLPRSGAGTSVMPRTWRLSPNAMLLETEREQYYRSMEVARRSAWDRVTPQRGAVMRHCWFLGCQSSGIRSVGLLLTSSGVRVSRPASTPRPAAKKFAACEEHEQQAPHCLRGTRRDSMRLCWFLSYQNSEFRNVAMCLSLV